MADGSLSRSVAYRYHPDIDVHEFTFHRAVANSTDEFIDHLKRVYDAAAPDAMVRLLIDFRPAGLPPMMSFIGGLRRFVDAMPYHPEARVAFLMKRDLLFALGRQLVVTLRWRHMTDEAFFPGTGDEYGDAVAWLLQGSTDAHRTDDAQA